MADVIFFGIVTVAFMACAMVIVEPIVSGIVNLFRSR